MRHSTNNNSWQVNYPKGLVRYLEMFRKEYIPYTVYDQQLATYLRKHQRPGNNRILSLGCGTGLHEANLSREGFHVVGLDKSDESLSIARRGLKGRTNSVRFARANILSSREVDRVLKNFQRFDAVIMLGVQLSMCDHARAIRTCAKYLAKGGIFVTGLWDYEAGFDAEQTLHDSCIEIATSESANEFAVRLNTYSYCRNGNQYFIDWDAVYLIPGPRHVARMYKVETNRIEVTPHGRVEDPIGLAASGWHTLPSMALVGCDDMCLPHTYEFLAGWRKP